MELDLRHISRIARRWWWLLLLGPVLGVAIATVAGSRQPEQYAATAMVTIGEAGARVPTTSFPTIQGLQSIANTYQQLMQTWPVLEPVITQLQLPDNVSDLSSRLSIQVVPNTLLMTITATDSDPERAAAIANAVVDSLTNYLTQQPASITASITPSAPARPPSEPYAPRVILFQVFGGLVAAAASLAIILIIALRDSSVRSAADILEVTGSPLLATIPSDRRARRLEAGRILFITAPGSPFAERIRLLRSKVMALRSNGSHCLCVALTGLQRGDGACTLTTNLAAAIAQTGMSVIVVDANLRAPSLHHSFGVSNEEGLTTLLGFPELMPETMLVQTAVPGVWLMPTGPVWPGSIDLLNNARLAEILRDLKDLGDVVLVDTPSIQRFSDALAVIGHTDGAILVGMSGRTVQSTLRRAANTMSQTGARLIGVVLNRDSGQIEEGRSPLPAPQRPRGSAQLRPVRSARPVRIAREVPEPARPATIPVRLGKTPTHPSEDGSVPAEPTAS